MLERAKGCLEHNGRRLFRLRPDRVRTRSLHCAFWSHGAGDIEIPTWWADLLSRSAQEEKEKTNRTAEMTGDYLKAGFHGGHLLDFLYTPKSREFMHKLAGRDRVRAQSNKHKRTFVGGWRSYASNNTQQRQIEHSNDAGPGASPALEFPIPLAEELSVGKDSNTTLGRADEPSGAIRNPKMGWHKGDSLEVRLGKLPRRVTLYEEKKANYDRTIKYVHKKDEDLVDPGLRRRALEVTRQLYGALESVISLAEGLVLDHLYDNKGVGGWSAKDWLVSFRIHLRRGSLQSTRFLKAFDTALADNKAHLVLPIMLRELTRTDASASTHRYRGLHQLHFRYNTWRKAASSSVQKSSKPFWEYVLEGQKPVSLHRLFVFFGQFHKGTRLGTESTALRAAMADTLIDLAKIIIRHVDFHKLESPSVLAFFDSLIRVVQGAPATYKAMVELLKTVLFQHLKGHKRLYADLHAVKLTDALSVHGGYKGEQVRGAPDLERKLFFHLTRLDLPLESEKIMRRLQRRHMDRVEDYDRLRFQLARKGDTQGLRREEANLALSETRLRHRDVEQFERLKTPPLGLYKDRLESYRRVGEIENMVKVFDELQGDPNATPDYFVYCQLISGYARANDLDGADRVFLQMLAAEIVPGIEAYAPILQALARQGDIATIRAITRSIEQSKIEINDWVVNSHVYAYLQRGQLQAAETLVWKALTFRLEDRTKMWNYVILAWALRGQRTKVNFLMDRMRRNNVPHDAFTYAARMQMWVVRGMPQKAWYILRKTMPKLGLRPLPFHYALVIRGLGHYERRKTYMKDDERVARQRLAVQAVYRHMLSIGLHPDWNVKVAMSDALLNQGRLGSSGRAMRYTLRLLEETDKTDMARGPLIMSKNVGDQYEVFSTGLFDWLFRLSRRKNHIDRFNEVWALYVDYISKTSPRPFSPPLRILLRLMLLFRRQKSWGEVSRCWDSIVSKANDLAKLKSGSLISARRALLAGPLHSYLMSLHEQGADVAAIKAVVEHVLKSGFILDNRCWNLYIRILCSSGAQNDLLALETAEEQLVHDFVWYPRIMGIGHQPGMMMGILRRGLLRRETFASSFSDLGIRHYPFRSEASIGKGLPAGFFDTAHKTAPRHLDLDSSKDEESWDEVEGSGQDAAVDLRSIPMEDRQSQLDNRFAEKELEDIQGLQRPKDSRYNQASVSQKSGLNPVTAYIDQGSRLRRPEYATLVFLAGIYINLRKRMAFDPEGARLIEELHEKCPKTIRMILKLPRTNDKLQRQWLNFSRTR